MKFSMTKQKAEHTYVARYGDELWNGVKGLPNLQVAGFL